MQRTYLYAWLFCLAAGVLFSAPYAHGAKGCCARHGGIDKCDEASGLYRCKDGRMSDCPCVPAAGFRWSGKVVQIFGGQSLEIETDGQSKRIFLYGIIVPERSVQLGPRARAFLRKLVLNRTVTVELVATDQYAHQACWVFIDSICVNTELLKTGLAYWDKKRAPDQERLNQMEQEARKARKGMWQEIQNAPVEQ